MINTENQSADFKRRRGPDRIRRDPPLARIELPEVRTPMDQQRVNYLREHAAEMPHVADLGKILGGFLAEIALRCPVSLETLVQEWSALCRAAGIVEFVAAHSAPTAYRDGKLTVSCESSSVLYALHQSKPQLQSAIHARF